MSLILIIIKLFDGDPDRGLPVQLELTRIDHYGVAQPSITSDIQSASITSILELQNRCQALHQDWVRCSYRDGRIITIPPQEPPESNEEELAKRNKYKTVNSQLINQLNQWVEQCLRMVDFDILKEINISPHTTPIRLAFETKNHCLQELPWEKCSAFSNILANGHRLVNTVVSPGKYPQHQNWQDQIKILLILGGNENINTQKDLQLIEEYIPKNAQLIIANKCSAEELHDLLWDNAYDIIIFSGHSSVNKDGQDGFVDVNDVERRSIDSLSNALSRCVDRGLRLLVLNSCSGIGLARKLSDNLRSNGKRLPFIVAMRRPILDEIAHSFLKRFLMGFFRDGYSLETAMTEAREFLQQWEDNFPGATSLPILLGARKEAPLFFPVPLPFWKKQLHILRSRLPINNQLFLERPMKIPPIFIFVSLAAVGIAAYNIFKPPTVVTVLPTGSFTMASSSTAAIIFNQIGHNIRMKYPNYLLTLDQSPPLSTTHALEMLRKEQVNFAQISRLPKDPTGLTSKPMVKSVKAVAVNPRLNFHRALSLKEIDAVCKGSITNWRALGGEDLPIVLFPTNKPSEGVVSTIGDNCQSSNPKNRPVKTPNDALRELFKDENRGGFFVGSASVIANQCQAKVLPINNGGINTSVDIYKKKPGALCDINNKNEINLEVVDDLSYPRELTDFIYITFRDRDAKSQAGAKAYTQFLCTDGNPEKLRKLGFVPICEAN